MIDLPVDRGSGDKFADANALLDVLLPDGGLAVSLVQAFMDESKPTEFNPFICVAGYAFEADAAKEFNRSWGKVLHDNNLDYFRMSECNSLQGQFKGWDENRALKLSVELIAHIRDLTLFGFGITIHQADYERALEPYEPMPGAYGFGCFGSLMQVRRWIERTSFDGKVAYIFEAPDEDQERDANRFMTENVFAYPRVRAKYRYRTHAFSPKLDEPALQAGDLLAWHYAHWRWVYETHGKKVGREDFQALVEDRPQDVMMHYDLAEIEKTKNHLLEHGIITLKNSL